jgi:uncharacterized low-complexity protein
MSQLNINWPIRSASIHGERMKSSRRSFMIASAGLVSALSLSRAALAQTSAKLAENDPQALDYRDDATKVDKAKYPKYAAGQSCGSCQLYQGKSGDVNGPCAIFQNKLVPSKGWCSAWGKKG